MQFDQIRERPKEGDGRELVSAKRDIREGVLVCEQRVRECGDEVELYRERLCACEGECMRERERWRIYESSSRKTFESGQRQGGALCTMRVRFAHTLSHQVHS